MEEFLNITDNHFFANQGFSDEKLTSVSGEGNVVYINGKIKPGYKLDLTLTFDEDSEIKIKNFEDDGDFDIEI